MIDGWHLPEVEIDKREYSYILGYTSSRLNSRKVELTINLPLVNYNKKLQKTSDEKAAISNLLVNLTSYKLQVSHNVFLGRWNHKRHRY